jgi:hypothetical protein
MEKIEKPQSSLIHDFNQSESKNSTLKIIIYFLVVVSLGVGSGYFLAKKNPSIENKSSPTSSVNEGQIFGSDNTKAFPDTAEGILREGGIDGEGAFHLERPGGESQYVYLTSSVVDLSKMVGKKIKVWGETQKAQKAGWLMDVGRVQIL